MSEREIDNCSRLILSATDVRPVEADNTHGRRGFS